MHKCEEISNAIIKGKVKDVKELVNTAMEDGIPPRDILNNGMLSAMDIIGEDFAKGLVFLPDMMYASSAMKAGLEIIKPSLSQAGVNPIGRAVIGTVKGDQHDIGKNLVATMFEGKGIDVIDLGANVSAEQFVEAAEKNDVGIIACSSLLTTTMGEMKNVVDLLVEKGLRDKITVMIGGAPVSEGFCKEIGADYYTPDATTAADVAKSVLTKKQA